jgi:hypothetical protein
MKKTILIFGLIIGTILSVNMIIMVNQIYNNPDFKPNDILGYAAMIVIFSLIFFGVRNYRDKYLGGLISFKEAFRMGIFISLVASTIYVVVWLFYYYLVVPDFIEKYTSCVLKNTSVADLPAKTEELENLQEMYKNPFFIILITFTEVMPMGIIVSLASTFLLKKKITVN